MLSCRSSNATRYGGPPSIPRTSRISPRRSGRSTVLPRMTIRSPIVACIALTSCAQNYAGSQCRARAPAAAVFGYKKTPFYRGFYCGRYWDRTSDLFRVREARYRCANRPNFWELRTLRMFTENGGGYGIRTRVNGFAGRCLASRPIHQLGSYQTNWNRPCGRFQIIRADDEIRTRDPHLGKVMRYHCATSATVRISAYLETLAE